jgi:hypothetical protein
MSLFRSQDQGKTWQDMRVDRFSPFTYGRDIKVRCRVAATSGVA